MFREFIPEVFAEVETEILEITRVKSDLEGFERSETLEALIEGTVVAGLAP